MGICVGTEVGSAIGDLIHTGCIRQVIETGVKSQDKCTALTNFQALISVFVCIKKKVIDSCDLGLFRTEVQRSAQRMLALTVSDRWEFAILIRTSLVLNCQAKKQNLADTRRSIVVSRMSSDYAQHTQWATAMSSRRYCTVATPKPMRPTYCRICSPGSRVLDVGCGPGSISVGLAKAIDPGELHGIDMEESQIEIARASAAAGGHANTLRSKSAMLPISRSKTAASTLLISHAVLMHVPDTEKALSEIMRVLKPGGILASREVVTYASFVGPDEAVDDEAWSTFSKTGQRERRPSRHG